MNYLSVEGISKSYGLKKLFENITFGLEKGQKTALIAKNGAGKTTLLNVLAKKESPDSGIVAFNNDIEVGFLEQEPSLNLSNSIIEEVFQANNPKLKAILQYEKALQNMDDTDAFNKALESMDQLQAWDAEAKAKEILSKLGLNQLEILINQLSGGQKKRVSLAKILLNEPDLLILDEPTNHLDLNSIEWLENYLATENITLLMVTHDRYFLERVCNEIIELHGSNIYRYKGNYSYYLEKKEERAEVEKANRAKAENLFSKELEWVRRQPQARATKAKYRVEAFHELKKKLQTKPNGGGLELDVLGKRMGKKVLEIKHLSKKFDDFIVLEDFNYLFKRREKVGILGENGVGKTTFLKMLMGEIEADSGEIEKGETIQFGYYKQDGLVSDESKKVIEVVKDIAEIIPLSNGHTISASQMLERFLFTPETQYQYVSTLSGGERKRLYLLTVLMRNPNFLILDEPTNDLDIVTLNVLEDFLAQFDGCVIIVSHDRYFMDKMVDHLFIFEGKGEIRDFNGNCSEYLQLKEMEVINEKKQVESSKKHHSESKSVEQKQSGLSYNERLEYEELEKRIEKLESEKKKIELKLSTETDTEKLMTLSEKFGEISSEIDEKTIRWLELSEKA